MRYDDLDALRRHSPAWRLLRADNAPLVLSFLGRVFVEENVRSISAPDLAGRLDDELHTLNSRLGEGTFPKSAKAYLDDWAGPEVGWLRKYYPAGSDEPHFDATPAVEKALGWVESLQARSFVGTESRLNTVFELLRQMAFGAETDPEVRIGELRAPPERDRSRHRTPARRAPRRARRRGATRPLPTVLVDGQGIAGGFP